MAKKIFGILLNPTIDEIIEVENFHVGGTFKVSKSHKFPLGKAISFALSAKTLNQALIQEEDIEIKILACIGKEEIPIYNSFLDSKQISFQFKSIDGITRSNKTIIDPDTHSVTHIRHKGFKITKEKLEEFLRLIDSSVNKNDIVAFCGSIPLGVPKDIYFKMINGCKKKGAKCVLDTSGVELIEGYKAKPWMLKPNLNELISFFPESPEIQDFIKNPSENIKKIAKKSEQLLSDETEIVITTLNRWGAICTSKDLCLYGKLTMDNPINTIGSGDSFLGGFIVGFYLGNDLEHCFRWGLACGAANTLVSGAGIFSKKNVRELYKKAKFEKIDLC
jgi:1-phosphofructokinase family hexose kinase